MAEDVGILICSCDKNKDLWKMFLYYFYKYWPLCSYPLYLNTETEHLSESGETIKVINSKERKEKEKWSLRLKDSLKAMQEDYVLIILDDFFLTSEVDVESFELCVKWMKENKDIACFLFDSTPGPNIKSDFKGFEEKGKKAPYRFSLQIGLWNKKHLIKYLRNHESPWQFESWGSIRSRRYREKFYSQKPETKKIFHYPSGGVLCDNRWNLMNGEESLDFIKEDFKIDFNERGIYLKGQPRRWNLYNRSFLEKCWDVFKSLI